jgi:hypothetical protein
LAFTPVEALHSWPCPVEECADRGGTLVGRLGGQRLGEVLFGPWTLRPCLLLTSGCLVTEHAWLEDLDVPNPCIFELKDNNFEPIRRGGVEILDRAPKIVGDLVHGEHQPECPWPQMVIECRAEQILVELVVVQSSSEWRKRFPSAQANLGVELLVGHLPQTAGIAQQLADHRTSDLGVAVQLGFDQRELPIGMDEQDIERACGRNGELPKRYGWWCALSCNQLRRLSDQLL